MRVPFGMAVVVNNPVPAAGMVDGARNNCSFDKAIKLIGCDGLKIRQPFKIWLTNLYVHRISVKNYCLLL